MFKLISIDQNINGLILAEVSEKKVHEAIILKSELLEDYVKNLNNVEDISKLLLAMVPLVKRLEKNWTFLKRKYFFEEKILL